MAKKEMCEVLWNSLVWKKKIILDNMIWNMYESVILCNIIYSVLFILKWIKKEVISNKKY